MKGVKMIVEFKAKPRSKTAILRELRKDPQVVKQFPLPVLKHLATIAHEFDCMIRDTADELVEVKKENERLLKENDRLEKEYLALLFAPY